tara:strand:+ start:149 stop:379 length:231 start_codon:yes stop_codon:yes gene_type:complete
MPHNMNITERAAKVAEIKARHADDDKAIRNVKGLQPYIYRRTKYHEDRATLLAIAVELETENAELHTALALWADPE